MSGLRVNIFANPAEIKALTDYLEGMTRKMQREEMIPILKRNFAPIVQAEKANLAPHSKSGALEMSIKERAGQRDYPGKFSVFSSTTATVKQIIRKWSRGRRQQQGWAAGMKARGAKGRKSIFYGRFVEYGHKVRGGHGKTQAVHFAGQAMDALGDAQADAAAEEILEHILA